MSKAKEFTLTEYQRGVISTLSDMVRYMTELHVQPMSKALSVQLTQFAQEHFKYPEGTELSFDLDPETANVKVTEAKNGKA